MVTSQPPTCSAHLVTYPDDLHTVLPAKTQSSAVAVFLQKKRIKCQKQSSSEKWKSFDEDVMAHYWAENSMLHSFNLSLVC